MTWVVGGVIVDLVVLVVIMVLGTDQAGMATLVVAWVAHFLVDQVDMGTVGLAVLGLLVETVQASQVVVLEGQMLIGLEAQEVLDSAKVVVSVTLEVQTSLVAASGTWEVQVVQVVVLGIQGLLVLAGSGTLEVLVDQAVTLGILVLLVLTGLEILMMTTKGAAEGNFKLKQVLG